MHVKFAGKLRTLETFIVRGTGIRTADLASNLFSLLRAELKWTDLIDIIKKINYIHVIKQTNALNYFERCDV